MNKCILDVITGDISFHPDDMTAISEPRAPDLFKLSECSDDVVSSGKKYSVVIRTPKRFFVLIGTIALGDSFRIAGGVAQVVRNESALSFHGGDSEIMAFKQTGAASAVSLQIIAEKLNKRSRFSTVLDCGTHHDMTYLDVCLRFFLEDEIYNSNFSETPLFDWHTDQIMFEMHVKFLNALYPEWRKIVVGVSSGSDRLVTSFDEREIYWCSGKTFSAGVA